MRTFFIACIAVAVLVGGYLWYASQVPAPMLNDSNTYMNSEYGISFTYPDTYGLQEREVGGAERRHYFIMLAEKTALENIPEGGEGPPAITIDIFQNNLDKEEIEDWVRGNANSNFKLSPDGVLASTTVSGVPALFYTWDGLYRGESIVFAHKDNILMLSVTYLTLQDAIRGDATQVISSLKLH